MNKYFYDIESKTLEPKHVLFVIYFKVLTICREGNKESHRLFNHATIVARQLNENALSGFSMRNFLIYVSKPLSLIKVKISR